MNRDRDQNDTLDRLWAATRPEEPSADAFDRLWGEICDRASMPEVFPFRPVTAWKRWGIALAVTAQAAALLIAAVMALKPAERMQIAQVAPSSLPAEDHHNSQPSALVLHDYQLALGTTMFVNLEGREVREIKVQLQTPESDTDIQTAELDVLNFMESYE